MDLSADLCQQVPGWSEGRHHVLDLLDPAEESNSCIPEYFFIPLLVNQEQKKRTPLIFLSYVRGFSDDALEAFHLQVVDGARHADGERHLELQEGFEAAEDQVHSGDIPGETSGLAEDRR